MSEAKHTPGPWKSLEHSWSDTSIVADGFDHGICRLDINHATEESQDADAALMAANARLIASAPELLEALRGMMNIVSDSRGVAGYHLNGDTAEWDHFDEVDAAEAAIAKATGQPHG